MEDPEELAAAMASLAALPKQPAPHIVEYNALLVRHIASRRANVDLAEERAWLQAEAEMPESEESRRAPGLVAADDRRMELEAIPEGDRTGGQEMELSALGDVAGYAEAFPDWFTTRRAVLKTYVSRRQRHRKPPATPRATRNLKRPREHRAGSSRVARARAPSSSDDPHEQPPGNRANVVNCVDEILVLLIEQHDRVSVTCRYCGESKRGSRLTLLGDLGDHVGWWRGHACVSAAVAA